MSDLKKLMDAMPLPTSEPFPGETLMADGWQYRDLPRMTPAAMDLFVSIVGASEIRWLTKASYGDSVRGQCLISPKGFENMKAHANTARAAPQAGSQ